MTSEPYMLCCLGFRKALDPEEGKRTREGMMTYQEDLYPSIFS